MSMLTDPAPTLLGRLSVLWRSPDLDRAPADAAADARERCTFVRDMLDRNGDAFCTEEDVRGMQSLYPGHF